MRTPYDPYKRRLFKRPARARHAGVACVLAAAALLIAAVASGAEPDHGRTLRVTTDKAEVLQIAGTPSVVFIANPLIADVVVEQNHLLFVLGKRPGETRLYVYDQAGKALIEREVVVVPLDDRTVTVTRDVVPTNYSCDPRCAVLGAVGPLVGQAAPAAGPGALPPPLPVPAPVPGR